MKYERLLERQRTFFCSGKSKEYSYRINALKALREALVYYEEEINQALLEDLNKSPYETFITEYGLALQQIRLAERKLKGWMKPLRKKVGITGLPGKAYELAEPYGVALIISPWNYPLSLAIQPLIGAIAAGNCCIMKPSELSPHTSNMLAKIVARAFSEEYVAVVLGGKEESERLLEQRFDYIFFTGSTAVGRSVMDKAARHLTPVTLELGGKSPCIITADANVREAAKNIAYGKVMNSGQICIAPDYVLADETVAEQFCREFAEQCQRMVRDALTNSKYPRIISQKHFKRLQGLMEGTVIKSGGRSDPETLKIEPTVLVDVKPDSPVMQEEIFGPLLPVLTFRTLDEAEDFVQAREKPLALYLFTTSKETERKVLNSLSFGGACVNDTISHIACEGLAFGGVGQSGMGAYHGIHSFETFSHRKGIYKKSGLFELSMRYQPYGDKASRLLRFLMK
ncbi:aldehyde dehydrogenase [Anaerovorax odorimutans]|uniref:Aldehyde dehydrogenase n=1 Tax=Anaerovorax odorimutans TaxID=109327 RepID=A0ABT1RRF7_9FIRM|nr:aldehyde dehydrogenase [Anaerovorax odorimutans]MCQ4637734.1 aldehyde dehydrogenase [Anaerovorax odorimutans]